MNDSKGGQSDFTESNTRGDTDSGGFFKKYKLPTPPEGDVFDQPIFKKYAPVRVDKANAEDSESSTDERHPDEPIPEEARRRGRLSVWWGLAGAFVILAGFIAGQIGTRTRSTHPQQAETNITPSAGETPLIGGANGTEALTSLQDGLQAGKAANSLKLAHLNPLTSRSYNMIRSIMLARARDFEDRGMLLRAEQEYRTIAASFPDDTSSQFDLSRVQRVLSTKQQGDESRASRESGLKKFRMGDYSGAESDLSAAVTGGRTDTATLYALGMSCVKLGNHEKAETTLERCVDGHANYPPALVGLAQTSLATGQTQRALSLLERALELGGGAEFTPAKITEMISAIDPKRIPIKSSSPTPVPVRRAQPSFIARVVHGHAFPLTWCGGQLEILNSVLHFNASNREHSFQVLVSEIRGARVIGNELHFRVSDKNYIFTLKGRSAKDFLEALVR
ncbi:MAG: tetratricopeptide repeat protein [Blastocatellia bacterium]